jgi:hypothetical protein
LFTEVLRLLQEENKDLIRRLRRPDGTCNDAALVEVEAAATAPPEHEPASVELLESGSAPSVLQEPTGPWEELLRPLQWAEVESAWSELAKTKERPNPAGYLLTLVNFLTDASLLSLRLDPPAGYCVWPASAAQLVYSYEPTVTVRGLEATVRFLQPGVRALKELSPAINPLTRLIPKPTP